MEDRFVTGIPGMEEIPEGTLIPLLGIPNIM
jgi:hypothetical protein